MTTFGARAGVVGTAVSIVLAAVGIGAVTASPGDVAGPASRGRVAVVPINFTNDRSTPFSQSDAEAWTFSGDRSVAAYYREASLGALSLTGDTFDWQELAVSTGTKCRYWEWLDAAEAQMGDRLAGYDTVVYAAPNVAACGFDGVTDAIGDDRVFVNGLTSADKWLKIVAHELGHTLGADHARTYTCVDQGETVMLSRSCEESGYDPFDLMGLGNDHLPNANHLDAMGLLAPRSAVTVAAPGQRDITIGPLHTMGPDPRLIRIPYDRDADGNDRYLLLEYRQPSTYDDFEPDDPVVTGVTARLGSDAEAHAPTYLLDAAPETPGDFSDAPIPVGGVLEDEGRGLKIEVLAADAVGARVRITRGAPRYDDATCASTSVPDPLEIGRATPVEVRLDNTGTTRWTGDGGYRVVTSGAEGVLHLSEAAVEPGSTGTFAGTVTASGPAGDRTLTWEAQRSGQRFGSGCTDTVEVVEDLTSPTSPTDLAAAVRSQTAVEISWTPSTDNIGVTGYRLFRSTDGTTYTEVWTGTSSSAVDSGLAMNTPYWYRAVAEDGAGLRSAPSLPVRVEIPDITPPSAPAAVTATGSDTDSIDLRWTPSSDEVGVTGYRVYRRGLDSLSYVVAGETSESSFRDSGLSLLLYTYYVVAFDQAGNVSAMSNEPLALTCLPGGICL